MTIHHFEISEEDQKFLEQQAVTAGLTYDPADCTPEALDASTSSQAKDAEVVTIFVNSKVSSEVIDSLPNLKLLVTRSTGFDHIDVAHAKSKGITVCNVPAYGSRTVAEFTFALMLGQTRKTFHAIEQIKERNDWSMDQFEGFNLQGKTLGVVGTGRIGLNVIQIAKGFELNVIAYDAFPNQDKAGELGFSYCNNLDELLAQADIITFHVPANKDTHHLLNQENISKVKKGALLINTSRGDVIDSEAILTGLNEGILASVALDVIEGEQELKEEAQFMSSNEFASGQADYEKFKTLLNDHVLINHPKVIITPHIAFNTKEARTEIMATTLSNIQEFIVGQTKNTVNT